jgi:hypothetical protein
LRAKVTELLVSLDSGFKRYAAELLYALCDNDGKPFLTEENHNPFCADVYYYSE